MTTVSSCPGYRGVLYLAVLIMRITMGMGIAGGGRCQGAEEEEGVVVAGNRVGHD